MKTKQQPIKAVSKPEHYDQGRMINLWKQGKSITDIANDQGCSPVYARRVLSTKAPDEYKAGLEARHQETGIVTASQRSVVQAGTNGGTVTIAQAVDLIARHVAAATFSEAQLVPQPTTRAEMFENISKGVRTAVKKLGIGFHS